MNIYSIAFISIMMVACDNDSDQDLVDQGRDVDALISMTYNDKLEQDYASLINVFKSVDPDNHKLVLKLLSENLPLDILTTLELPASQASCEEVISYYESWVAYEHSGFGRFLRNNLQLFDEGSPMGKHYKSMGIEHPDEMSSFILKDLIKMIMEGDVDIVESKRKNLNQINLLPGNVDEFDETDPFAMPPIN